MLSFLRESREQASEDRARRKVLLDKYKKDASAHKLKGNIAVREQWRTRGDVVEDKNYSIGFLYKYKVPPGDEVLYRYKRKLQKEI